MLGIVRIQRREIAEAEAAFRRAIQSGPDLVMAHNNLGNVLRERGDLDGAVDCFRQAVRLKPDFAEPHNNLGNSLLQLGRLEEAEVSLRQALTLRPDSADVAFNLGLVLWRLEKLDESIACNRRAVQLDPGRAEAHANLGNGLMECGDLDAAIAEYQAALRLKPDAARVHSNLIRTLSYHPAYDMPAILEECRRWWARHGLPLAGEIRPHSNPPDPDRRLRIGYISPDFREHVDSFFMVPLLANHDRGNYEIFCYSDVRRPDALTARHRELAGEWRAIEALSDTQVAELVREDRIDILVDLKLHTDANRLLVFAASPRRYRCPGWAIPGRPASRRLITA